MAKTQIKVTAWLLGLGGLLVVLAVTLAERGLSSADGAYPAEEQGDEASHPPLVAEHRTGRSEVVNGKTSPAEGGELVTSTEELCLTLLDERTREPVEGGLVKQVHGKGSQHVTGSDGRVNLRVRGEKSLAVSADGYRTRFVLVDEKGGDCTVLLKPGEVISGHVSKNGSGFSGATVVAWPAHLATKLTAEMVRVGDPRLSIGSSRDDGSFELEGLDPDESYCIVAGADSLGSWPVTRGIRPGAEVRLILKPVFGVVVRYQDLDGRLPEIPDGLFLGGRLPYSVPDEVTVLPIPSPFFALFGVEGIPDHTDPGSYVILVGGEAEAADAGPFSFTASLPGYVSATEDVWAFPMDHGGIQEHVVRLVPLNQGRGRLRIRFRGTEGFQGSSIAQRLFLSDRTRHTFLREASFEDWIIEGIPNGKYGTILLIPGAGSMLPSRGDRNVVEIADNEATWEIDLSSCAGLHIEVLEADGHPYAGPLSFRLLSPRAEGYRPGETVVFEGPPYYVWGLTGAEVVFSPKFPAAKVFGWSRLKEHPTVPLVSGQASSLTLRAVY